MRRFLGLGLGLLILASCSEGQNPTPVDVLPEDDPTPPAAAEINDGASGLPGANPHFYYLTPVAENNPAYTGIQDDNLEPTVTVCPFGSWDAAAESCGAPLATFTMVPDAFGNVVTVTPGSKYGVVFKTNDYPVVDGQVYRIAVSVAGEVLGWADIAAYDQQTYNSFQHTDPDGNVAISDNGNLNINFRIEYGALEFEKCDLANVEDCDVLLLTFEESGCARVYEHPGQAGETLGSQACVPANQAYLNGEPVQGTYAVILTLEELGVSQGGGVPDDLQVPYFSDLSTDPPGISFTAPSGGPAPAAAFAAGGEGDGGVDVVICQVEAGPGAVPEDLHPQLRPFIVYPDGTTELPEQFSFGAPECEALGGMAAGHAHGEERGLLGRFAGSLSRVSSFFLPRPLVARRIHGGLNTTVYDTGGDAPDGGENAPAFEGGSSGPAVELGAILDVDPLNSVASVPGTGQVGVETSITIIAQNAEGAPFPFEVPVTVNVLSGTDAIVGMVTYDGDGVYTATYTPTTVGTDVITITIDGEEMAGSPYSSTIAPRSVDAAGSTFEVSYSEAGSATTVTVWVKDTEGELYIYGADFPIDVQVVVVGPNGTTVTAEDPDGDGIYVASFTPDADGNDEITVTIAGQPTGDSPITITTLPRPADPSQSTATLLSTDGEVPAGDGKVDARTDITIDVRNTAGLPYDYVDEYPAERTIDVQVSVSGANTVASFAATDADGDGTYDAAYTPTVAGTDFVAITLDGIPIAGSPYTSEVAPRRGDINVTIDLSGPGVAPVDGLPVNLYSGTQLVGTATTDASGVATFTDIVFGSFTVHLPMRDFDAAFPIMTQSLEHHSAPSEITFTGTTQALPTEVAVYRVKDGGNGNAFEYILNNRSWTSAQNQVGDNVLLGVPAHLASITSAGENAFVAALVGSKCPNETNPKKCKYQGWIGLNDQASEGNFVWTTGEALTFTSWDVGEPSGMNKEDQVEINFNGKWSDENGASSTNEGYVGEWEAVQPPTPPF